MFCRAVTVECLALKPCWKSFEGRCSVRVGRIVFSRHLAIGESRDIGLYEVPAPGSLFGFGIGMILASFHI